MTGATHEGVWQEFPKIVLIPIEIIIVQAFNVVRTISVTVTANFVVTSGRAFLQLIDTFPWAVQVVVHFGRLFLRERKIVIGVAGRHRVIVVGLVLNDWIVPTVADQYSFKVDLVCPRNILAVLLFNVFVDHRAVMTTVLNTIISPKSSTRKDLTKFTDSVEK